MFVKTLGWSSPSERLARSAVESGSDGNEVIDAVP